MALAVDADVGRRLRAHRMTLGLSQSALAEQLGVTFQQIQKYEKGTNRISASRLQAMATLLGIKVADLFDEPSAMERSSADELMNFLSTPEGVRLAKAFMQVRKPRLRRQVVSLVEAMATELSDQ